MAASAIGQTETAQENLETALSEEVTTVQIWADPDRTRFMVCVAAVTLLHGVLAATLPISGDEAYYWDCSRHLDLSYFDQPPLVVWGIAASRLLWGDTALAVRFPAIVCSLLIALFLVPLVRHLGGGTREATLAYLLMHAMPLFFFGFFYCSTDIVMSTAFLGAAWAALSLSRGDRRAWWGFGIAVGVGFLAKFSAVLVLGALLGALASRAVVRDLKRPTPYLAGLLSAAVTTPVWIWAARHHGDNIFFQLVQRHSFKGLGAGYLLEFLGVNLLLVTPTLGAALAVSWWLGWRRGNLRTPWGGAADPGWRVLSCGAISPILFFGAVGLEERVGPHWSGPGLILMTLPLVLLPFRWKRALVIPGIAMGVAINAVLLSIVIFPMQWLDLNWAYRGYPQRIATAQLAYMIGNREIAAEVEKRLRPGELAASESYGLSHLVALLSQGRVPMRLARITSGRHGLSSLYWYTPEELAGKDVLFFTESPGMAERLAGSFASIEEEEPFLLSAGERVVRRVRFYLCRRLIDPENVFTRLPPAAAPRASSAASRCGTLRTGLDLEESWTASASQFARPERSNRCFP